LQKKYPPISFSRWVHGCTPYPIVHPRQLTQTGDENENFLVATREQAEYLYRNNFKNVHAVGVPFLYAKTDQTIKRQANSLLVMPAHSLPYTNHAWDQENYAMQIEQLKPYFSSIVVCLHESCIAKGYWTRQFENRGIPWILGADLYDRNALKRIKILLSSFEYMTTNTIGSHVVYANFCGCKTSVFGEFAESYAKDFQQAPLYQKFPELLKATEHFFLEKYNREQFPFLFCHPKDSNFHVDWAAEKLGRIYQKSPDELALLLGWSIKGQTRGLSKYLLRKISKKINAPYSI
jgi:hypothetical protein